ncbi:MAG: HAD-IA family hydrolase [Clostridia bacterium]
MEGKNIYNRNKNSDTVEAKRVKNNNLNDFFSNVTHVLFDIDSTLIFHDYTNDSEKILNYYGVFECADLDKIKKEMKFFFEDRREELYSDIITKQRMAKLLEKYVPLFKKYNISGIQVIDAYGKIGIDKKCSETKKVLQELKKRGYRLGVVSNWFRDTQMSELNKYGYTKYFDEMYFWDNEYPKPHIKGCGVNIPKSKKENYVFIGDNLEEDILFAKALDIKSIWLSLEEVEEEYVFIQNMKLNSIVYPDATIKKLIDILNILK